MQGSDVRDHFEIYNSSDKRDRMPPARTGDQLLKQVASYCRTACNGEAALIHIHVG